MCDKIRINLKLLSYVGVHSYEIIERQPVLAVSFFAWQTSIALNNKINKNQLHGDQIIQPSLLLTETSNVCTVLHETWVEDTEESYHKHYVLLLRGDDVDGGPCCNRLCRLNKPARSTITTCTPCYETPSTLPRLGTRHSLSELRAGLAALRFSQTKTALKPIMWFPRFT